MNFSLVHTSHFTKIKVCCFASQGALSQIQDKGRTSPPALPISNYFDFLLFLLSPHHPPIHPSPPSTYPSVCLSRPFTVHNHPSHEQASSRPHPSASIKQIHTVCLSLPTRWTSCPHKRPVALSRMAWGHASLTALHPDGITIDTLDTCFNSVASKHTAHSSTSTIIHQEPGTTSKRLRQHSFNIIWLSPLVTRTHPSPPCDRLSPTSTSLAQQQFSMNLVSSPQLWMSFDCDRMWKEFDLLPHCAS